MTGRIYDALRQYFEASEWTFEPREDEAMIAFPVVGENGAWFGFANALEEDEQLLIHSVLQDPVPEDRREEVARFVTTANFGTVIGNFELDYDEGELRYKTSVDVEGAEMQQAIIRQLLLANVVTTDFYLPGIEAVITGAGADEALAALESDED